MNVIKNILRKMDEERLNTTNANVDTSKNETITFDDDNLIQSISAGAEKINNNSSNNSNAVSTDKVLLDFSFVNDSNMSDNINSLKGEIDSASKKWGISPNLISAIISQESSGGTSSNNIMQIEFNAHKDVIKNIYDFDQNKEVSFVLTNDKSNPKYKDCDYVYSLEDISNKNKAINIGTALLAECMQDIDYNIPLGIQEYNLGPGGIRKVVRETAKANNTTTNNIYYDQTNTDFTKVTGNGDPNYVKNVVKYLNIYDNNQNSSVVNVNGYNPYTKEIVNKSVDFTPSKN